MEFIDLFIKIFKIKNFEVFSYFRKLCLKYLK